nr:N-acetylneuraminate synthase family protein [Leucobacter weissii]
MRNIAQGGDGFALIAEAGVNHNGDLALAHRLIDAAVAAGAHIVKFQTFVVDQLVAPDAASTPYQRRQGGPQDQTALLRSLALPREAWPELRRHADDAGIGFLSTPFDLDSARLLVDLGVDALKVPSGELTNTPFIAELAGAGLPLLLSTGMAELPEIDAALAAASAAPAVALFHCVSAYPAPPEDCNLAAIPALHERFGVPVGWSDHTLGADAALAAAALGARLFEKHFTLDRTLPGPDHQASLTPDELGDYAARIARAIAMLGDGRKRRMPSEEENAPLVRRSWHAARPLPRGHVLTAEDLVALRPETGLRPSQAIAGRRLARDLRAHDPITEEHLEEHPERDRG